MFIKNNNLALYCDVISWKLAKCFTKFRRWTRGSPIKGKFRVFERRTVRQSTLFVYLFLTVLGNIRISFELTEIKEQLSSEFDRIYGRITASGDVTVR